MNSSIRSRGRVDEAGYAAAEQADCHRFAKLHQSKRIQEDSKSSTYSLLSLPSLTNTELSVNMHDGHVIRPGSFLSFCTAS